MSDWELGATRQFTSGAITLMTQKFDIDTGRIDPFTEEAALKLHSCEHFCSLIRISSTYQPQPVISPPESDIEVVMAKWSCKQGNQNRSSVIKTGNQNRVTGQMRG